MKRRTLSPLSLFALAVALTLTTAQPSRADSAPRVIEITAKRFGFSPNQITLKKGETVKFRLISQDVEHGFFLRALKVDEEILPGQTNEITVTPQTAGTFTLICDHFCGANHGNMMMTVIVE